MNYSKFQKFISSFLIFSLLFSISFRVPFNFDTFAGSSDFYNLVSVIVDEDTYDELKSEINRYSKDIQGVLENTKVVILPTPVNTPAFNIASLNESLYTQGYKSVDKNVDFESKLVGTVIIGDFNLPTVFDKNTYSRTILPLTDFDDKVYIYNHETNRYEKNVDNKDGLKSEIWHGVITPNLGTFEKNISGIRDYLDKNHDYYSGTGNFKYSAGVLNGNNKVGIPSVYEPYVFYYDQFREEKALNYNSYEAYESYLENKEDILYSRFNKKLSDAVINKSSSSSNETIAKLLEKVDPNYGKEYIGEKPDTSRVPDIHNRYLINNVTKKFLEIFAKGTIGDFRKDVHNAGRYNGTGSSLNVDMIPYFVTVLDLVNDEITKDINTELEKQIDELVKTGLSRYIALPTSVSDSNGCGTTFQNYLFGKKASDIKSAAECSIYRGSNLSGGTLVEANRGYNINYSNTDKDTLYNEPDRNYCFQNLISGSSLNGFWGGNSPLNLDTKQLVNGSRVLKNRDFKGAIYPVFDIGGSQIRTDSSKIYSPLNCLENNFILAQSHDRDSDGKCYVDYRIPTFGGRVNWSCTTDNNSGKTFSFSKNFENNYKNPSGNIILDGKNVAGNGDYTFSYKKIPSFLEHKSPTSDELTKQIESMIAESLPIDKNRYVDFVASNGEYAKIEYPNLFRLKIEDNSKVSYATISKELDKVLDEKSKEINELIRKTNPNSLIGKDKDIYNLLKIGSFPKDNFDLTKILKNKEDKTFKVAGDEKTLSYYDTLVLSLYWNNLNSTSAKYGFIFDNYLIDQFGEQESKYLLPKNKKQYEISYLGAPGDAKNMYIKMDPKAKAQNPYADIFTNNINLSSTLLGANVSGNDSAGNNNQTFKCAPPDGVPIWSWIPAVMCWLGDMMPPSISISEGVCGPSIIGESGNLLESSFLSDEERKEVLQCNGDVDKNGINDCIEQKLSGAKLELSSDSEKYFYNKNAILKAEIKDKNGKTVKIANSTDVYFELYKLEIAKDNKKDISTTNKTIVYNIKDSSNSDLSKVTKYITFKEGKVRSQGGIANYGIGLKFTDANIFLKAYIREKDSNKKEAIFLDSDPIEIQVRGDKLFNISYKLVNSTSGLDVDLLSNSLKVNDKTNLYLVDGTINNIKSVSNLINNSSISSEKFVLLLENIDANGKKSPINYPLNISILEGNNKIVEDFTVSQSELNTFKGLFSVKKSGSYKLEITDSNGFKTTKSITFLPEIPNSVDIKLGTSVMESGGNISTNFLTIYDKFLNPVVGEFYDIDLSIDGKSIQFLDNSSDKLKSTTFEGYKVFRLKSTDKTGKSTIKVSVLNDDGKEIINTSKNIEVYDDINLVAKPISGNIKVGGGKYKFEVSLRDSNGKLLSDFNSRAYMVADTIFLDTTNPYFELKNGVAEVEFTTKRLAGKNIPVEFQVEGLKKIVQKNVTIYPDKAVKIDLNLSKSKIEASPIAFSNLNVELKDRYNNLVFNDNTTVTTIEILDQYANIISSDKSEAIVKEGTSSFRINGTVNPGVAYFKIGTNPSLFLNSFKIQSEKGEVEIKGVGENALKIETFYFWNDSKLNGKKYNSIYTTLLGSNYGDIYEQDYLAGSLLFERNNRSLAVTSILNNPFSYNNILDLNNFGGIKTLFSKNDLSQDLQINPYFVNNKLGLNIYNKALNIFVAKVYYNFGSNIKLSTCENNISTCVDPKKTSIVLKSSSQNYKVYNNDSKLILRDIYGKNLLEILNDGTINRLGSVEFEFNNNNSAKYLSINIKSGGKIIGELGYNFINPTISTSNDDNIFDSKIKNTSNSIAILIKSGAYGTYNNGNINSQSKIFYYNDPFTKSNKLNSFSSSSTDGIENFANKKGIGWDAGNKSLLAFSAGKSVGESVKDYMSFGVINLGDPVITLKQIKQKLPKTNIDRKYDSTIGKLLSIDDDVKSYQVFDYNNDNKADILLVKNDNYLKLLENKKVEQYLLDKGNVVKLVDLGSHDLLKTGDFTGDGYEDIFFVSKDGKPFLLNNENKDFSRISLIDNFSLAGRIVRAEKFDMDKDGKDDLVILDDFGELNIFYGGGSSNKPIFTKKRISAYHGVTLNSNTRNDGGLVFFDGLYQPGDKVNKNSQVDSYLFIKYPYSNGKLVLDKENYISGNEDFSNDRGSSYFLKSEYSEYSGLKVEKTYIDKNSKFISANDIVEVEVKLKNVSNTNLKNVVFAEKVPDVFSLDKNSFKSLTDFDIFDGNVGYSYLIDNFDIPLNGTVTFSYKTKVKPLKYNKLEVGLFETGELGDDIYGDIILKPNNQNCSNPLEIYRSGLVARTYEKGTKTPVCDEQKSILPPEIEQNTFDADGNGVPDYIDKLTNTNDTNELQKYSKQKLSEINLDSDYDGIPNDEDNFNMDGSITVDLGGMGAKVDSALDSVDNIVQGLNCGFGNESCFASPLNWAPLAPGSDPIFMGRTIGDGLKVDEGLPIFSMNTWQSVGPLCVPSYWPASVSSIGCSGKGAGGALGIYNPTNFFRIFVTPTLTGGVGTAICFGGPAAIAGISIPQAFSPLFPGGNCIVVAKKTFGCAGDGSDGDVGSTGIPNYSTDGSFGLINGNCKQDEKSSLPSNEKLGIYLQEAKKGPVEKAFEFLPGDFSDTPITPLFSQGDTGAEVSVDLESLFSGDFEDVIKIDMSRISPFPSWLMDWVTRQIEEIANKLTDFPTLFVILPDFTGILDGNWGEMSGNKSRAQLDNLSIDPNLIGNESVDKYAQKVNSGIKEAYEFIGSLPLVYIDQETVNINLPWLSDAELNRTISTWSNTLDQREFEVNRASEAWSMGNTCKYSNPDDQKACVENNELSSKASVQLLANANGMIGSLRNNIEVIKSYKRIPEDINDLITKKQDYLEQTLCNIDTISFILGGRIGKNGIRFKAWVELYILIKAVLKSWQLLVDVFFDYEQECHDCKNERQDALEEEFSLIDMIMPKIPIIRFPKWPDIILDLHNIRAGLRVTLPEYNITSKPIILPSLPELNLPNVPSVDMALSVQLPEIPVLPTLEIPRLPDLPSLPTIELPDLPPPPKLPKLLSSIEIIVDIIKLITKAMCILKSSVLHPEWRAGDQIAFLTERTGYLSFDFFQNTSPEFSFPFIDAIKVSTYVNMEFEADFIVELARQMAMPINAFTNDFTNMFDVKSSDMDFRDIAPVGPGNIDIEVSPNGIDNSFGKSSINNKLANILAQKVSTNIQHLANTMEEKKGETVDNTEFKKLVNNSLASKTITSDPKLDSLRQVWEHVNSYTYSNEDKLIKELQDANTEKFDIVTDILNTEIIKNKELKKQLENSRKNTIITKVGSNDSNKKIEDYNKKLSKYNDNFIEKAKNLVDNKGDGIREELKESSKELLDSIKTPLENYKDSQSKISTNNLLAATNTDISINSNTATVNSCQAQSKSQYKYKYEGLYILEGNTSYRLFDYLDELDGNEQTKIIDIDNDGDEDLLYFVNGQLFLKENLQNKPTKIYLTTNPLVLKSSDNKFFNGDVFFDTVNNFREFGNTNSTINIGFSASTNKTINNYRIGFYQLIDKYLWEKDVNYRPQNVMKSIIDGVSNINQTTKISENEVYVKRNNIVYINNVGNLKGVKLQTSNLINIKDDLGDNKVVNLNKGTQLYAGGNSFSINYLDKNDDKKVKRANAGAYENLEFLTDIKIIGISGSAYIKGSNIITYEGPAIRNYLNKPLFPGTKILYDGNENIINEQTYIDIKYYDNSELGIDFSKTNSWELYDLGYKSKDYYIRTNKDNDLYYAKINSFKNNIDSTLSSQVLFAPQKEADTQAPELRLSNIRIPVYQKNTTNLTQYIYEDSGIRNIKKIIVDMDLDKDTDGDGNSKNDDDGNIAGIYKDVVKVIYSPTAIKLEFAKFDNLFKKKIGITMYDANNNRGYKEVNLEVYSPKPRVNSFNSGTVSGSINENLTDEPINLYRFRGGVVSSLNDDSGINKSNTIKGNYKFNISSTGSGLKLYRQGLEIANIDENSGKISFNDLAMTTQVLSSNSSLNDSVFPKILVKDSGLDIYYQYVHIQGVNKVNVVEDFQNLKDKGIYFVLTNKANYSFYSTPETLDYNPGALSIYRIGDKDKKELFTIFKDGRINTQNEAYKLEYVVTDKYWYFKLIDTSLNKEVGRLMFIANADYIMR
ncbi:MAG: FG-GAP-like repeat-containing protein [Candidatus Gracilibacteria bacterium]|nr:FG-GAP-like repeat-containing protein [Candidatus Gracilibacteria bacterium]